jgi:hypothetical protein
LVNVPEPLKGARIDDFPFVGCQDDKPVNRITELVMLLGHDGMVAAAHPRRPKFYFS